MLRPRIIPVLLLREKSLVKTIKFNKFSYIGDPCNTVRIFNEFEVDEIVILDINKTLKNSEPNYDLIKDIASEAFMPLSYGGGINTLEKAKKVFSLGIEKVILNSAIGRNPFLISEIADIYGSQAVTASVDVKRSFFSKKFIIHTHSGTTKLNLDLISYLKKLEKIGAGEVLLNSIDKDGTWEGYEIPLYKELSKKISIPLIACGGAKNMNSIEELFNETDCNAAGVGSMVLFQKKDFGVLVNYPKAENIDALIAKNEKP